MLLDSLPVPETLSLFLSQRIKALHASYTRVSPSLPLHDHSAASQLNESLTVPLSRRERSASTAKPLDKRKRKEVLKQTKTALQQTLEQIGGTTRCVREIYAATEHGQKSKIEKLLHDIQRDVPSQPLEPPPTSSLAPMPRSRLSMIYPPPSLGIPLPANPPLSLTTHQILHVLPSSQLLTQFLPASITSYVPYIDINPSATRLDGTKLEQTTHAWFSKCIRAAEAKLTGWLIDVEKIRDVWEIRDTVGTCVPWESQEERIVVAAFDVIFLNRVRELWSVQLHAIGTAAITGISGAIQTLRANLESASTGGLCVGFRSRRSHSYVSLIDRNPASYLSSSPVQPTHPSLAVPTSLVLPTSRPGVPTPFDKFKSALRQHVDLRTPMINAVLTDLEGLAASLKADLERVRDDENNSYVPSSS